MDEVWAIVLGASLATIGGIIGAFVTDWMQKRKEKKDKKVSAYLQILTFLHTVKFSKSAEREMSYHQIAEITALGRIYASVEVQAAYDDAIEAIIGMYKFDADSDEYYKEMKTVNALISFVTALMKKEMRLSDKKSRKLLEITLKNKERKNAN